MSISMTVDRSGTPPWSRFRWEDAAAAWTRDVTPLGLQMLRAQTPVGHSATAGRLRSSETSRLEMSPGSAMVMFYTTVPYAKYVIDGTGQHTIVPRRVGGVLRWLENAGHGPAAFATKVQHPGTKPNPFPDKAMEAIGPAVSRLFAEAVQEAMEL